MPRSRAVSGWPAGHNGGPRKSSRCCAACKRKCRPLQNIGRHCRHPPKTDGASRASMSEWRVSTARPGPLVSDGAGWNDLKNMIVECGACPAERVQQVRSSARSGPVTTPKDWKSVRRQLFGAA